MPNHHVIGHSDCDCSRDSLTQLWTCAVEAHWKTNGT
jgi:hypothetical protein